MKLKHIALLSGLLWMGITQAQVTGKTVRIITSFSPGGPVDFVARAISDQLGKELGQTVIVENRPGGNGVLGALETLRSAPDGNTIWITSVGAAAINKSLYPNLPYDTQRDFAPVSMVVDNVEVFVVKQEHPSSNANDFIAQSTKAKKSPAIASSGTGSIPHLALIQLEDASGVEFLHIPYKGMAHALTDIMGNQVEGVFADVPAVMSHLQSGRLKALGIASSKRHAFLPDVPTFEEQGLEAVDTNNWYGLFVPANTPKETIATINQAVKKTLEHPEVHKRLVQSGAEPKWSTPEDLGAILQADTDKWATLISDRNIQVE